MAGRRSAAPRPPIIAQKIIIDSKFWVSVIAIAPNPYPKSPRIYAFFLPIKSPILLPTSMKAADTSASRAIADCTPLTVVCKSLTTDEIETFIKEVSMTSTNIAAAKRSERVVVGLLSFFSSATIIIPPLYTWVRSTPQPASSHTYHRCTYPWCTRSHCRNPYLPGTQEQRTCRLRSCRYSTDCASCTPSRGGLHSSAAATPPMPSDASAPPTRAAPINLSALPREMLPL